MRILIDNVHHHPAARVMQPLKNARTPLGCMVLLCDIFVLTVLNLKVSRPYWMVFE